MQGMLTEWDRRPRLRTEWPSRPYRIEDGALRPESGGKVKWYDPFGPGYYQPHRHVSVRPLYAILWELDYESPSALKKFAKEWGILGTFLHDLRVAEYAEHASLWPSEEDPRRFSVVREGESPQDFAKVQWTPADCDGSGRTYRISELQIAIPAGITADSLKGLTSVKARAALALRAELWELSRDRVERERIELLAQLIPGQVIVAEPPDANSIFARLEGGPLRSMDLPGYYRPFFPDGDLPTPDSPYLYRTLSEPIDCFRRAVLGIREAYALCVCAQQAGPSAPLHAQLARVFAHHLHAVAPALDVVADSKGKRMWETRHSFPSLLAAIYLMLLRDFTTPGRFLRHCAREGCGRPVVTDRKDRYYCARDCTLKANNRRWSARKRAKAEAAKGETK